jgi:hypothetical protein
MMVGVNFASCCLNTKLFPSTARTYPGMDVSKSGVPVIATLAVISVYALSVGVPTGRTLAPLLKIKDPVVVGELLVTRAISRTPDEPMVIGEVLFPLRTNVPEFTVVGPLKLLGTPGPAIVTVGATVYPLPGLTMVKPVTKPLAIVAVAVA